MTACRPPLPGSDWFVAGRTLIVAGRAWISSLLRSTLGVPVNGFQPNPGIAPALYNGYEVFRRRAHAQERLPAELRGASLPGRRQGIVVDPAQARSIGGIETEIGAWAIPGPHGVCVAVVSRDPARTGFSSSSSCAGPRELGALASGRRSLGVVVTITAPTAAHTGAARVVPGARRHHGPAFRVREQLRQRRRRRRRRPARRPAVDVPVADRQRDDCRDERLVRHPRITSVLNRDDHPVKRGVAVTVVVWNRMELRTLRMSAAWTRNCALPGVTAIGDTNAFLTDE